MRSRPLTLALASIASLAALVSLGSSAACSSESEPSAASGGAEAGADADPSVPDAEADVAVPDAPGPDGEAVLASGLSGLAGIVANETSVYVVSRTTGAVHVVPLGGGPHAELASSAELPSPSGLALVGNNVFWIDSGAKKLARRNVGGGTIDVATLGNGMVPSAIVAAFVSGAPKAIVTTTYATSTDGDILQYDANLTSPKTLQKTLLDPFDVATTGTLLVWTESVPGSIWHGQLDSTSAAQFVLGESGCESIAADARGVYWTRPAAGLVRMTVAPDGAPLSSLATAEVKPFSLAADESGVYWLTEDGKLRRSTRTELPPGTISKGFASTFPDRHVQAIALTSKYVVWITSDGSILRHDK